MTDTESELIAFLRQDRRILERQLDDANWRAAELAERLEEVNARLAELEPRCTKCGVDERHCICPFFGVSDL